VRTLIIGIPLPDPTFDNYSFISAPSISEYRRLVVEMSSVVRVIEEVARGSAEHRTFVSQPVVNGPATGNQFALDDLLAMRQREAEAFFARGGTALFFAYPETVLNGIHGSETWGSYSWLPAPEEFSYRSHLLPGFGNEPAEPVTGATPFTRYFQEFARASRYRVSAADQAIEEAGGHVLARSAGGLTVAFQIPLTDGNLIITPPLLDPAKDRALVAEAILEGFDALSSMQHTDVPEWIRKEVS
jgi:hypothetical protein